MIANKIISSNIYILSNDISFFTKKLITANLSDNSRNVFEMILSQKTQNMNIIYVHISGHGYQGTDVKNIELDGKCEQISLSTGIFHDYDFNALLEKYIPKNIKIRILIDTCHSGTFSNFRYRVDSRNNKILETKKNGYFLDACSISACQDNQLDSCDIGDFSGFGGGLTVHMLDNGNLIEFLLGDPLKVKNKLLPILKKLNQDPVMLVDN